MDLARCFRGIYLAPPGESTGDCAGLCPSRAFFKLFTTLRCCRGFLTALARLLPLQPRPPKRARSTRAQGGGAPPASLRRQTSSPVRRVNIVNLDAGVWQKSATNGLTALPSKLRTGLSAAPRVRVIRTALRRQSQLFFAHAPFAISAGLVYPRSLCRSRFAGGDRPLPHPLPAPRLPAGQPFRPSRSANTPPRAQSVEFQQTKNRPHTTGGIHKQGQNAARGLLKTRTFDPKCRAEQRAPLILAQTGQKAAPPQSRKRMPGTRTKTDRQAFGTKSGKAASRLANSAFGKYGIQPGKTTLTRARWTSASNSAHTSRRRDFCDAGGFELPPPYKQKSNS